MTNFLEEIRDADAEPLWDKMAKLSPHQPQPKAIPHVWRYDAIRRLLLLAGQMVTPKQAERRVLMLVNPKMTAPCTTDTLFAGLQLVLPGTFHIHTANSRRDSTCSSPYVNSATVHY